MRIAIIAAPNQDKEGFLTDFIKVWQMYTESTFNIDRKQFEAFDNKVDMEKLQQIVQDSVIDEMMTHKATDNVIYTYTSLDNLINTLWLSTKEENNISQKFVEKSFKLTHISLTFLDLIIFLPKLEKYKVRVQSEFEDEEINKLDEMYTDEINNLFLAVQESYNKGDSNIFPFETVEGSPALIEIFGTPEERIQMTKLYLDVDGQPFGKKSSDSLIQLPNIEEQGIIDRIVAQTSEKPIKVTH